MGCCPGRQLPHHLSFRYHTTRLESQVSVKSGTMKSTKSSSIAIEGLFRALEADLKFLYLGKSYNLLTLYED